MVKKALLKTVQVGFTAGELDPVLLGRTDQELYYKGAALLRNVAVNPQGHLTRRPGTEFIDTTTNSAASQSVEFEFNNVQTYLIVFTAGEFKVYKNDILQATVTSAPISSLTADQVQEMKFVQSADTLLLFHKNVQTIKITRTSHTAWVAASITYNYIPWFAFISVSVAEPNHTLTLSAVSGKSITATASGGTIFSAASVGQYIYGKTGGIMRITGYTSGTVVTGQVEVDFPAVGPIAIGQWEYETGYVPVWSATAGWPSCGTFHQNRLWVANSGERPQTIWGSQIGKFFDFNVDKGNDDNAIDVTIDDNRVNAIRNLVSGRNLQIYTTGGEFYVPTGVGTPITPAKMLITKSTAHGSSNLLPVSVGGATVFVENAGKVVRDFIYNDLEQNYSAKSLSILSSHLIGNPVSSAARASTSDNPADYLYLVNDDGTLAVLNIAREQDLLAWSLWTTNGKFEEVTVLGQDVYVTVKRTINGNTVRYIEKFNNLHFTDASLIKTNNSPTTAWSGLGHLEAETVRVRGDNYVLDSKTVANGAITSSLTVSELEAGLNFTAKIKTLPLEGIIDNKSLSGDWKRLVSVNCRLNNTRNIVIKYGDTRYVPSFTSFGSNVLDTPVQTFTGWKKVYVSGVERDVALEITQDDPLELELLSLTVTIK